MARKSFTWPEYFYDPEEQARVDAMLMNEELSRVEARGIAKGEARGEARGEAKGMLKKSFNIARNLFKLGISKAQIKESTGLSATLLEKARRDEPLTEEEIASALA